MSLAIGVRSWYSYNEGFLSPRDAVIAAKKAGATAIAFADKGELAGYFDFIDACKEEKLPYLPGIEANLKISGETRQVVLFGLKAEGEKKLLEIISQSTLTPDGERPPDVGDLPTILRTT